MTCPGLHCPGCSGGQSLAIVGSGVVALAIAYQTAQWVHERIWWIGGTAAACFAVATAVSMALEARSDRRGARYAAEHGILSRADVILPEPERRPVFEPAQERREIRPPTVINLNIYTADAEASAARIIRTALPGQAGAAITHQEE